MNPLDLVAILLVIIAVVLGFQSGALPQIAGLLGAVAGGALAILALVNLGEPLGDVPAGIRPYVVLAGLLMAVGVGESAGSAIGRTAARSLGTGVLGAADRLFGSVTGVAQALLVIWLAGGAPRSRTGPSTQRGRPDIGRGPDAQRRPPATDGHRGRTGESP